MQGRFRVLWLAGALAGFTPLWSQQPGELKPRQQKAEQKPAGKEEMPPEEDVDVARTEYAFNPLQAEKDLKVGNYYFKLGKYRAAEGRFRAATRWNEGYADAWLRLGEAAEKLRDPKTAAEAYRKYLEIAADAKNAGEIRKRVEKLK